MSSCVLEQHLTATSELEPAQAHSAFEVKPLLNQNAVSGSRIAACIDGLLELRDISRRIEEQRRKLTAKLARAMAHEFMPISSEREEEDPLQPLVSSGRTDVASVASLPCEPPGDRHGVTAADISAPTAALHACHASTTCMRSESPMQTLAASCCAAAPSPATPDVEFSSLSAVDAGSCPASPSLATLPPLPRTPVLDCNSSSPLAVAEVGSVPLPPLLLVDTSSRCEPHPPPQEPSSLAGAADATLQCRHDDGHCLCRAALLRCVAAAAAAPSCCCSSCGNSSNGRSSDVGREGAPSSCSCDAALHRVAAYLELQHTRAGRLVAALLGLHWHCMRRGRGRAWQQLQHGLASLPQAAGGVSQLRVPADSAAAADADAGAGVGVGVNDAACESSLRPHDLDGDASHSPDSAHAEESVPARPPSPPAVGAADTGLPLLVRSCCGRVEPPSLLTVVLAVLPLLHARC